MAGSYDRRNHAGTIDPADRVIFGVGDVDASIGRAGHAFGAGKLRLARIASIARIALLARTREVINFPGFYVEPQNRIAFAQCEIVIAVFADGESARAIERSALKGSAIGRRAARTGAGPCRNGSRLHVERADAEIQDVAD